MAYDALAESVALIESRHLVRVPRLSRRRRFAAMSVDVAGDVAVTMFARRGVGCTWHDFHVLALRHGRWALLGGGGGSGEQDLLADRPQVLTGWPTAGGTRAIIVPGAGGARDSGDRPGRWPWSGRWVSYADVRVSAQVESLSVSGRVLPVPWHGHVAVVWVGRRGPLVGAHDRDGRRVDEAVPTSNG